MAKKRQRNTRGDLATQALKSLGAAPLNPRAPRRLKRKSASQGAASVGRDVKKGLK